MTYLSYLPKFSSPDPDPDHLREGPSYGGYQFMCKIVTSIGAIVFELRFRTYIQRDKHSSTNNTRHDIMDSPHNCVKQSLTICRPWTDVTRLSKVWGTKKRKRYVDDQSCVKSSRFNARSRTDETIGNWIQRVRWITGWSRYRYIVGGMR